MLLAITQGERHEERGGNDEQGEKPPSQESGFSAPRRTGYSSSRIGCARVSKPVSRVVIVGGGTAGWLSACLVASHARNPGSPPLEVTLFVRNVFALNAFVKSLGDNVTLVNGATLGGHCLSSMTSINIYSRADWKLAASEEYPTQIRVGTNLDSGSSLAWPTNGPPWPSRLGRPL